MKPVTDPAILSQLEGPRPVTDQMLLAQLDEGTKPSLLARMLSDIGPEIKNEASANLDAIRNMYGGTAEKGVLQQTLDVGKGLVAIPGLAASPITGAAKSLIGHPLAAVIQGAGSFINPEAVRREDPRDVYEEAKSGVDQAMMAVAPRAASPTGLRSMSATIPSASELKKAAVDVWESPKTKSISIPPSDVGNLSVSIANDLTRQGFRSSAGSASGTFEELRRMSPPQNVGAVSVDDMRAARRALAMTEKQRDPFGQPTPDAVAARQAIAEIDNFLDGVSPQLREANANYAAGKRSDALDYRLAKAEHRADRTGSGSNIENTMRQEVDKITDRGLSTEERALRDRIVTGTPGRNALRKVGKLGVSDGLSLLLHAGSAVGTGGATLPIAAAGTAARKIGEMLTRKEIAQLDKLLRGRSPLAQALAAQPHLMQTPQGTKALAAALLSQGAPRAALGGFVPAYAEQNK